MSLNQQLLSRNAAKIQQKQQQQLLAINTPIMAKLCGPPTDRKWALTQKFPIQ